MKEIMCCNCEHSYYDGGILSCNKINTCLSTVEKLEKKRIINGEEWYTIFCFSYKYFLPKVNIIEKFDGSDFEI